MSKPKRYAVAVQDLLPVSSIMTLRATSPAAAAHLAMVRQDEDEMLWQDPAEGDPSPPFVDHVAECAREGTPYDSPPVPEEGLDPAIGRVAVVSQWLEAQERGVPGAKDAPEGDVQLYSVVLTYLLPRWQHWTFSRQSPAAAATDAHQAFVAEDKDPKEDLDSISNVFVEAVACGEYDNASFPWGDPATRSAVPDALRIGPVVRREFLSVPAPAQSDESAEVSAPRM